MPSQAQAAPGGGPDPAQTVDAAALQAEIERVGMAVAGARPAAISHPLRGADRRAMRLASRDEELRAALFRLVDVTPACRSVEDIGAHLASLVAELDDSRPAQLARALTDTRAGRVLLGRAVAAGVRHTARRFIAGEGPREAEGELSRLWGDGIATSLDLLGEATVSSAEADAYAARCARTLAELAQIARAWPPRPALERDFAGEVARANLSVKVSSLTALLTRRRACARCWPRLGSSALTSTSTWSPSTRSRRPSSWRWRCWRRTPSVRAQAPELWSRPTCEALRRSWSASSRGRQAGSAGRR